MSDQLNRVTARLEKLKVAEEKKAKKIIKEMQQKVDEAAKKMATQNAEYQKQKQELEIGNKLTLEKYQKKPHLEEKYQKEIAELEAKNLKENANFAKEMTSLKDELKEKINWDQVDRVMGKYLAISPIASAKGDCGDSANTTNSNSISTDGLNTSNATRWTSVSAKKGFHISADSTDPSLFPSLFYFEVTQTSSYRQIHVGLSSENIPNGSVVGELPNSYAIQYGRDHCWLSGSVYPFEWPNGAIKPKWNGCGDVIGCGLLLNTANELFLFFTRNGLLIGKQIPINPTAKTLYPTVTFEGNGSIEANFGNDFVAKPFKYDIKKCPGMVLE